MKYSETNLNERCVFVQDLPSGISCVPITADREPWWCEVKKDSSSALVEFYRRFNKPRNEYSKYDETADLCSVRVNTTAPIDIEFFRARWDVQRAQEVYARFNRQLTGHWWTLEEIAALQGSKKEG